MLFGWEILSSREVGFGANGRDASTETTYHSHLILLNKMNRELNEELAVIINSNFKCRFFAGFIT